MAFTVWKMNRWIVVAERVVFMCTLKMTVSRATLPCVHVTDGDSVNEAQPRGNSGNRMMTCVMCHWLETVMSLQIGCIEVKGRTWRILLEDVWAAWCTSAIRVFLLAWSLFDLFHHLSPYYFGSFQYQFKLSTPCTACIAVFFLNYLLWWHSWF